MGGRPPSSTAHFAALPAPRVARTKRHRPLAILPRALCAVLCGADDAVGLAACAAAQAAWLRTFRPLPGGLPCHDTPPAAAGPRRAFAARDPEAFQARFVAWVRATLPSTAGQRPGGPRPSDGKALRLVSAWARDSRPVLGQVAAAEQANESGASPALLRLLDLAGATVAIAALGCQAAIAAPIVAQGAADVLALKQHHPTLREEVAFTCAQERHAAAARPPAGTAGYRKTVEQGHGRLEIRRQWTRHDPAVLASLDPLGARAQLRANGLFERQRQGGDRGTTGGRYAPLSAPLSAAAIAAAARSHRGIANRAQGGLDVAFGEAACRARAGHAARNLAVVRHLARNRPRQDASRTGRMVPKRFTAALDDGYLTRILAGVTPHQPPVTNQDAIALPVPQLA